jgi:hypothetical protein
MKKDYKNNNYLSPYDDSEYNSSSNVEKQIVNVTYLDPPKPLYDPNNAKEGIVSNAGGMIVPMMLNLNTNNKVPIFNINDEDHIDYAAPKRSPKDHNKEQRIQKLKGEIHELDLKVETDETEELQEANRCCRFCPTSKKGKLILLFIVLFFLGLIGILAYVFFPVAPDFKVKIQTFKNMKPNFQQNPEKNTFRLRYALNMTVEVYNNNRFAIKPEKIRVDTYISPNMTALLKTKLPGNMLTGKVNDYLVGRATVGGLVFPAKGIESFSTKLNISFSPDEQLGIASDPAVGEILRVCRPDAIERNETMTIVYVAYINVGILNKLGINPKLVDSINIGCPLGKTYAAELFKDPMLARFL